MVSLGVWVGGFILATLFGGHVAGFLPQSLGPLLSALVGFLIVFGVVLIVGWLVGLALSSAVRASGLAPADRALGSVFGLVRGLIIVLVVVLLAGLTPLPREPFWRDAALSGRSRPRYSRCGPICRALGATPEVPMSREE